MIFRPVILTPLLLSFLLLASAGSGMPDRRNIMFIFIDDLNDWVRYLDGHPLVKTPHLDRLAARGVAFTNAHTAAPLCGPNSGDTSAIAVARRNFTTTSAERTNLASDPRFASVLAEHRRWLPSREALPAVIHPSLEK